MHLDVSKKDRQCTHNVTFRHVYETIVAVGKQQVLQIVLRVRARPWVRIFVCVRASGCVHVFVCARVCVCERGRACSCALVAILIQNVMRRCHVVCGFSLSTFFGIIS